MQAKHYARAPSGRSPGFVHEERSLPGSEEVGLYSVRVMR